MDTRVPSITTSAPERARALQTLLDQHGPEMDRRREVTPEVVDALVQADMLRLLLPKSMGGQEMQLVEYCQDDRGAGLCRRQRRLVHQPVERLLLDLGRRHAARDGARVFGTPDVGLAWGARHGRSKAIKVPGGYRVTGSWSFAFGRPPHDLARRHSAIQNPDGTPHARYGGRRPQLRVPALRGQDHRRLAGARPARHRQRLLLGRGPVHPRRAGAGARRARGAARARPALRARLDPALRHRLQQHDAGHRPPPVRDLCRAGPRQAQPRLAERHGENGANQREIGHVRGQAVGRPRLHPRGGGRPTRRPRRQARRSTTASGCASPRPTA